MRRHCFRHRTAVGCFPAFLAAGIVRFYGRSDYVRLRQRRPPIATVPIITLLKRRGGQGRGATRSGGALLLTGLGKPHVVRTNTAGSLDVIAGELPGQCDEPLRTAFPPTWVSDRCLGA
jgi:hypothetical protein